MGNLVLFGHNKYGVVLLLENIWAVNQRKMSIKVVTNQELDESTHADYTKASTHFEITKETIDRWKAKKDDQFLNTGMSPRSRKKIFESFFKKHGITVDNYINSIHPSTNISYSAQVGQGIQVGPMCWLSMYTQIEDFVVVHSTSCIAHDARIGKYSVISQGCQIGSETIIGENTILGLGATVFNKLKIGKNSFIGGGSVVTKDIPDGVVAYGVPARIIRPYETD